MEVEPVDDVNENSEEELEEEEEEDSSEESMEEDENEGDEEEFVAPQDGEKAVYLPGQPLDKGEGLDYSRSAYRMYHQAQTGAPCLSFDVIRDDLGVSRETYPLTMYLVAGTQAARAHVNNLLVMKMTNLTGKNESEIDSDDESDDDSSDSDEENEKGPKMQEVSIRHQGCVNRIRFVKKFFFNTQYRPKFCLHLFVHLFLNCLNF